MASKRSNGSKRRGVSARKKRKPAKSFRSAVSGRFVTAKYGRSHPSTTVAERRGR